MSGFLSIEAHQPQSEWNDSLAYVDALSDAQRAKADALVQQETESMRSEGLNVELNIPYVPDVSQFLQFEDSVIMRGEMTRIESGIRNMPPMDTSRTALDTPRLHSQSDPAAWRQSADNAAAQLEHQHHRIENFKLGLKFGPGVWKAHLARTDVLVALSENKLRAVEAKITKVNQRRKLQQEQARLQLQRLQSVYGELLNKNTQITIACQRLEDRIGNAGSIQT